ncbi:TRAF-type zinc finger domain-containing protein 1 isoform 1-T2 [Leptodactylus fuscus]|uniref:TRAF-type zinc finger domain-containing protein 1 n=1 Tax=Leptodactylus fuscus TaxID=238119 RepID=UPI003F4EC5D7
MASSAEQETRLCGNCKRDILVDNFTIHEIHCRRNIGMCKLCNEPIPRSDMEDHYASEHAPVTCKCNMTVEKCALDEHEKSVCPLRLVKCQFCELEVTFNTLGNHEDYCGARTEPCEKCGSSVMIKDLQDHPTVCGKVKPQKKPERVRSWTDNREFDVPLLAALNSRSTFTDGLYSQLPRHVPERFYGKSVLTQSLKKFDDINQNNRRAQNREGEQANLGLNIDGSLDFFDQALEERSDTFRRYDHSHSQSRQNNTRASPQPDSPLTENNSDFWRDFYCKDNAMKMNVQRQSNNNYFSKDEPSTPTADTIQLPCEFCEELFPEQDLILHQTGCRPEVSTLFRRRSPSPPLDFTENLRSSSPSAHYPQSVLIPCEFCGVLMEGDILFHHQDQCDMGPNSEKTSHFPTPSFADDVSPNVSEEEHRSYRVSAASQTQDHRTAPASDATVSSRNQPRRIVDNTTRGRGRIDNLYRQMSNPRRSNLEEMRKKNIEENSRMIRNQYEDFFSQERGASNRNTSTRSKPTKTVNTRSSEVDKEE